MRDRERPGPSENQATSTDDKPQIKKRDHFLDCVLSKRNTDEKLS